MHLYGIDVAGAARASQVTMPHHYSDCEGCGKVDYCVRVVSFGRRGWVLCCSCQHLSPEELAERPPRLLFCDHVDLYSTDNMFGGRRFKYSAQHHAQQPRPRRLYHATPHHLYRRPHHDSPLYLHRRPQHASPQHLYGRPPHDFFCLSSPHHQVSIKIIHHQPSPYTLLLTTET